MKSMMRRTTGREIKNSFGRYAAILAIVALGVGFFSGLKMTKPLMYKIVNQFVKDQQLFDFRLISTQGIDKEAADEFAGLDGIRAAEGAYYRDALCVTDENDTALVVTFRSLTAEINKPVVSSGRMPLNSNECLLDDNKFDETAIGSKIIISEFNDKDTLGCFREKEYVVTGLVHSPIYMNFERGSSNIGKGSVECFAYVTEESFASDCYTEMYIKMDSDEEIYSEHYKDEADRIRSVVQKEYDRLVDKRYNELLAAGRQAYGEVFTLEEPKYYVLGRETNVGYACFESDSDIVDEIAKLFPVFFFLVAALICMTTMNRMVEEQRTQIGILKALGYSNVTIMNKYLFYSGSAAFIGCVFGFGVGTYAFPKIIWSAYGIIYSVGGSGYVFDPGMLLICLAASMICSVGTTWMSCRYELREVPARLIIPKAPKSGKRIVFERIGFVWDRMKFLHKVSVRNIFRYKKRLFMMIIGISGCTALVVAALGLNDSISSIVEDQYGKIQVYDIGVSFDHVLSTSERRDFENKSKDIVDSVSYYYSASVDLTGPKDTKNITLIVPEDAESCEKVLHFKNSKGQKIAFSDENCAVITKAFAQKHDIDLGDTVSFLDSDYNKFEVKISGICENYVDDYIYISAPEYRKQKGKTANFSYAWCQLGDGVDSFEAGAILQDYDNITSTYITKEVEQRIGEMLKSLNAVIYLVIGSAAALAFIVLYNLTNINITERIREIATIKVLGFYANETASYVFRENLVLSIAGALVGLLLGKALHGFIMNSINLDGMSFRNRITPLSYVIAFVLTIVFAVGVSLVMRRKLDRIDMAESLKSVE